MIIGKKFSSCIMKALFISFTIAGLLNMSAPRAHDMDMNSTLFNLYQLLQSLNPIATPTSCEHSHVTNQSSICGSKAEGVKPISLLRELGRDHPSYEKIPLGENEGIEKNFKKALRGYRSFRDKYAHGDASVMQYLSRHGQKPEIMVVACSDSRVDPALILQCDPGDLFVVRNVANIVPPYEKDDCHHGTSAALEYGVCHLNVKHLIILGHSQCGGIETLLKGDKVPPNDFISNWISLIHTCDTKNVDKCAKEALNQSFQNCMTFPWLKEKVKEKKLIIHLWFFDIETGKIFTYVENEGIYKPLEV